MPVRRARPSLGVARSNVSAVVKWFNPTKGFGFVQLDDGSPDAFLHISVVEQTGHRELTEGTSIVCDLAEGGRGLQVAAIHSVDLASAPIGGAARPGGGFGAGGPGMGPPGPGEELEGTVKFFNAEKGFGFVTPTDGSKDVFVSARTLQRAGLPTLDAEQRVRMTVRRGQKGPMAQTIELL